ncbi:hypothetical protein CIB48_g9951 [Xylaria polymorpha]|nr:hypothetical protein CIB48_g9951 [Xylaria polymorpha]
MDEVSQTVFALAIAMIPTTAVAIALRIWDRFGRSQVPGWDDVLIILSWILSMVLCAIIAARQSGGHGCLIWTAIVLTCTPSGTPRVTGISIIRLKYVIDIDMDDTCRKDQLAEALIWSAVEVCSLIVCSCIPSFRRVALKIPYLNKTVGLSAGDGSVTYVAQPSDPVPLQNRNRKEYTQSASSKFDRTDLLPSTTHTAATTLRTIDHDRNQDDCFPHRADSNGAIMVTQKVIHGVKSQEDSIPSKASDIT